MMFTRPSQPELIQGSGTQDAGVAWPIASSPIHLFDGTRSQRRPLQAVNAPHPAVPREGAVRVHPQHRLDDASLTGAELRATGPAPDIAWRLRSACQEAALWFDTPDAAPSPRAVLAVPLLYGGPEAGLPASLARGLQAARLPPGLLEIAISQADLAAEGAEVSLIVSALRDLGVGVALDCASDAGVCLRILHRQPLTAVRLHPSLVQGLEDDVSLRTAVWEAVRMAHAVGAIAVALGVQSARQRDILADLGCDEAEGPLFAVPLSGEAFRKALGRQDLLF